MTEEFLKIKACTEVLKGSFKGVIIKAGDLKSGTKDGKDWTKKVFTIGDDSGEAELVTWGDEIKQFEIGKLYEIVNPWWKTYEGKVSVQVGKYGTAKFVGDYKPDPPATKEQTVLTPPKTEEKIDEEKISKLTDAELFTVEEATMKILSISLAVGEKLKEVTEDPDRTFVMEATKIIYDKFFVANFKNASDPK